MGGGGSTTSTVSSNPWKGQEQVLLPLFQSALYGATGRAVEKYDSPTLKTEYYAPDKVPDIYKDFFGSTTFSNTPVQPLIPPRQPPPVTPPPEWQPYGDTPVVVGNPQVIPPKIEPAGKLKYFGDPEGFWADVRYPVGRYSDPTYGAPTIAKFTLPQLEAQWATRDLAESRTGENYPNSLLGKSEAGLKDIVSGTNEIPYWDINTPVIRDPGDVSGQKINYTPNMSGASITYNPNMRAADFDYRFWNPLGEVATGEGGNPYLDDMVSAATRGLQKRYTNEILPYLNSSAEEASAGGSGAWADLRAQESENYLKAIGDVEANIRGNAFDNQLQAQLAALGIGGELAGKTSGYEQEANRLNTQFGLEKALANAGYEQEANRLNTQLGLEKATTEAGYGQEASITNIANDLRRYLEGAGIESDINKQNALLKTEADTRNIANIMQAITGAPAISEAGYDDIGALAATGAEEQLMNQDILDAYISREEQGNLEPWNRAALLSQLIGGNFGGTATQTAKKKGK